VPFTRSASRDQKPLNFLLCGVLIWSTTETFLFISAEFSFGLKVPYEELDLYND
jgi:hypothetical protein